MNRLLIILFGLIIFGSCTSNKSVVKINESDKTADSTEYVVIVNELGFDTYLATRAKPEWYYEESYYKHFNQLYTNEWNYRVQNMQYNEPFYEQIDYKNTIDYGMNVEYTLFWYFQFMMEKYNFKLLLTDRTR